MNVPPMIQLEKQSVDTLGCEISPYWMHSMSFLFTLSRIYIQYQSKFWTHLLIQGFLFILYYFLHCRIIVKTIVNYEINHLESCSNQNKCYLWFFKEATLCQKCAMLSSRHSFNQLHLECFNSPEEVPTYAEHLLAAFPSLCGPTHPKPSHLGWSWVIVEARSSMQHSITLLIGQIALTQPGGSHAG
jgi:hypothetical protein